MPEGEITHDSSLAVPEHVVSRSFGGETVLLNLSTGKYHGINATGEVILDGLREHGSVRKIAEMMAARFDMPLEHMEADVVEFVSALQERGLVEVGE